MTGDVRGPAGAEGRSHRTVEADRARIGDERAEAAHVDRTEVAGDVHRRFTAEEAVFTKLAGVGREAVFELEADLEAVAEVFRAAQTEAGRGVDAGIHRETVFLDGIAVRSFVLGVVVHHAVVDDAVDVDVGGVGLDGKRADGGRNESLLEHVLSLHCFSSVRAVSTRLRTIKAAN